MSNETVVLVVFGLSIVAELLLHAVPSLWHSRKTLSGIVVALIAFSTSAAFVWRPGVWAVFFAFIGLYRVCNILRIAQGRMHEAYLRQATRRSSSMLISLQTGVGLFWIIWSTWHVTSSHLWVSLAALQLIVSAILLASVVRRLKRTGWPAEAEHYTDAQLPAITIAIPARNETQDLDECLQSVVASDYPKLEVLVYDDCSQERRTPEIIRGFAHDGVRFIQGSEPTETWLAKNQAYARLSEEASGDFIVFCGVDVRFAPDSLQQLIAFMLKQDKRMLSILPRRDDSVYGKVALIQAMRYWWELVPPRRFFNRPAVMSSCWVITADTLKAAGGFAAVSRSIVPEAYFAKRLLAADGYSFRRSDTTLGILSAKSAQEQRDTAVRMRYPQLHRRPENVLVTTIAEGALLILPFVLAIAGSWLSIGLLAQLLALASSILLIVSYELVVVHTHINKWWLALFGEPCMALVDLVLLHYSMWRYEFSVVTWKGRNVCVPAMHVVPHLPPLPAAHGRDSR
jgi:hypothetical protein